MDFMLKECDCCGYMFLPDPDMQEISPGLWDIFCPECISTRCDLPDSPHNRRN